MCIHDTRAFTLLEVLLAIATIGILVSLSLPVAQVFQTRNDINLAATTIAQTVRRAQVLSRAVDEDAMWGVYITSSAVTLFQGTDFGSRNSDFDEEYDVNSVESVSGDNEFVFTKLSGETTAGTVVLTSPTGDIRNISVNKLGVVTY